jgi:hypothetical protein
VIEPTTPIADYGLIAGGESAALVSRRGSESRLAEVRDQVFPGPTGFGSAGKSALGFSAADPRHAATALENR